MGERIPTLTSEITEGPFVVGLKTQESDHMFQRSGRLLLGGPEGSAEKLFLAFEQMSQLPDGLSWEELYNKASDIFHENGFIKVDL